MKVVLIQPPIQDFYDTEIRLQPLGLASLKAAAEKHLPGVHVVIKDFHHGRGRRTIAFPEELKYLKSYYSHPDKSPFSTFHNFYHFGADYSHIADEICAENPNLVGISALFSPYYCEVLETAKAIKLKIDVPVVVGGAHVSAQPLSMLLHPAIDFVIRGEGERPFVELIEALMAGKNLNGVSNLGYKKNGQAIFNVIADNYAIEDLPDPDYSDLDPMNYQLNKKPLCMILTSRGCPYHCTFCSVHNTFGEHYRQRPVSAVINEIKKRYEQGCRIFDFEDDNLVFDRDNFRQLCLELSEIFIGKEIRLLAMNGINYQNLDFEILQLMKSAGFSDLNISLVSSNTEINRIMKRPHNLEKYSEVVQTAFKLGFRIVSYQILGLPGESVNSMVDSLIFHSRLPVLIGASPYYASPKIPLTVHQGDMLPEQLIKARLSALCGDQADEARKNIYTLFVTTRIIDFLKGMDFPEDEIRFSQFETADSFDSRTRLGLELLQKLLTGQKLFAVTMQGFLPIEKFQFELFRDVWQKINFIMTLTGKKNFIEY